MIFFTAVDYGLYKLVQICANQIRKYHPAAQYHVYDLGLLPGQQRYLKLLPHVIVKQPVQQLSPWGDAPARDGPRDILPPCLYKPYICKEALNVDSGKELIYLDADAMPWQRFSFPKDDFDVAVTLRSQKEIQASSECLKWTTGLLNAGVILFRAGRSTSVFIDSWIRNLEESYWPSDQQELNRLVSKCEDMSWREYDQTYNLHLLDSRSPLGVEVGVRILQCNEWNYYNLVSGGVPATAKIIHIKGSLHSKTRLKPLLQRLQLLTEKNQYA